MTDLLDAVLEAHGGLDNWRRFNRVRATIVTGGGLWAIKGQPQIPQPRRMTVALEHEWASLRPFGAGDQKTAFAPERVAIEKLDGTVVSERIEPRKSFAGHQLETPWDPLQRAYFNGYAMWTYLATPFLLARNGVSVREIAPVEDNGQTWRGLQAHFPPEIASHSALQEFYFGDDHLLRRRATESTSREAVLRPIRVRIRRSPRHQNAREASGLPRRWPRRRHSRSADGRDRFQRRGFASDEGGPGR